MQNTKPKPNVKLVKFSYNTLNKLDPFLVIQNELICNTHESKPKNIKHECKHKHHVKMKTCTNIKKTCKTYHIMFWNFKSPKKI